MKGCSKKNASKDLSVRSLADYVKILNKYPSHDFFFRGENDLFSEREAGAFRGHSGGWEDKYRDFTDIVYDFYAETAYRLNDAKKNNFLAFSQHYGIPTNLIDVSSSPLTALFFACSGKSPEGYVYLFDNEFIDVTPIIMAASEKNFVELMLEKDMFTISAFFKEMHRFEMLYPKRFRDLFNHLVADMKHYLNETSEKENPIKK